MNVSCNAEQASWFELLKRKRKRRRVGVFTDLDMLLFATAKTAAAVSEHNCMHPSSRLELKPAGDVE